jgi:hypothetical protein
VVLGIDGWAWHWLDRHCKTLTTDHSGGATIGNESSLSPPAHSSHETVMSAELIQALDAVTQRVMAIAAQDAELRSHLRALAQAILSATPEPPSIIPVLAEPPEEQAAPVPDEAVTAPLSPSVEARQPEGPAVTVPTTEHLSPTLAQSSSAVTPGELPASEVRPRQWLSPPTPAREADLPLIEARCRLKAEGARWAVTRRRRLVEGAGFKTEIDPQDRDIIAKAKELPDCFLWMNHPSGPSPADPSFLEDVAGCFEAVADAITLVRSALTDLENNQDVFGLALDLAAEAQSALRAAITRIDGPLDKDQAQVFAWLKATAGEQQVFIRRFMRADDMADPGGWADLGARINALSEQLEEARKRARHRKKLLGKLRYIVKTIAGGEEVGQQERWQSLAAVTDELVQSGVPPSNRDIRELLLPVLDDLPELVDLPPGFHLVLREIDRYLEALPPATGVVVPPEPTAVVREVARLLGGKSVVLIGGGRRPNAAESLKTSFGLKELYWIETREHQSLEGFEAYVARPDVAIVLLAIRWSSHAFGDVRQFCDRHGKLLVWLQAGYHPNQVALQILSQCSERLTPTSCPSGTG